MSLLPHLDIPQNTDIPIKILESLLSAVAISMVKPFLTEIQSVIVRNRKRDLYKELAEANIQSRELRIAARESQSSPSEPIVRSLKKRKDKILGAIAQLESEEEFRAARNNRVLTRTRQLALWFVPRGHRSWFLHIAYYFVILELLQNSKALLLLVRGMRLLKWDLVYTITFYSLSTIDLVSSIAAWIIIASFVGHVALERQYGDSKIRAKTEWVGLRHKRIVKIVSYVTISLNLIQMVSYLIWLGHGTHNDNRLDFIWKVTFPVRAIFQSAWLIYILLQMRKTSRSQGQVAVTP
jgi:hypothetical protein